jgi:hypothetical protein
MRQADDARADDGEVEYLCHDREWGMLVNGPLPGSFVRKGMVAILTTNKRMIPTIFREDGFRFFFYSREEARPHVHVTCAEGAAKFWLEPQVALAQNWGLDGPRFRAAEAITRKHEDEIRIAWRRHFGR